MRRVLACLAAIGVSVSLGACGGVDTTPPKTWTVHVCQALSPWRSQIAQLNGQAATQMKGAKTPAQTRDNMLELLDGARQSTETARVKVARAGVPDVAGGKVIADRFVSALAAMRDAYAKARVAIQGLSIGTPPQFYDGVATAVSALDKDYTQAGLDGDALASVELRKDFGEAPECR